MAKPLFHRPVDDRHDKGVFMLAFFGGVVGILATRVLGDWYGDPARILTLPDFLAIAIAVGIILVYTAYIITSSERPGISLDRAGDNAYYLGLLFTLISLAYSLYKVAAIVAGSAEGEPGEGPPGDRVIRLLPDFGLALASTIVGIFCRVLVQQFRNDPVDIETQARQELGRAVRELRASLLRAVADMNSLSRSTNAATTEMIAQVNSTLRKVTETTASTISQAGSKFDRLAQTSADQITKILKRSDTTMGEIGGVVTGVVDQLSRIEIDPTEIHKRFNSVSDELERVAQASNDQVSEILRKSDTTLAELGAVVAGVVDQISRIEIDPTEIQKQFKSLSEELHKLQTQLSHTREAQQKIAEEFATLSEQVSVAFSTNISSRLEIAADNMVARQAEVALEFERLGSGVSETSRRISDLGEKIEQSGDVLTKTGERYRRALDSNVVASSEYIDTLTDAAKKLRRLLDYSK